VFSLLGLESVMKHMLVLCSVNNMWCQGLKTSRLLLTRYCTRGWNRQDGFWFCNFFKSTDVCELQWIVEYEGGNQHHRFWAPVSIYGLGVEYKMNDCNMISDVTWSTTWIPKSIEIQIEEIYYYMILFQAGSWYRSCSSCHVGTLGKSFTRKCLWRFSAKLWYSIRAVLGAPLGGSGLEGAL